MPLRQNVPEMASEPRRPVEHPCPDRHPPCTQGTEPTSSGSREQRLTAEAIEVVTSCDESYLPYAAAMTSSLAATRAAETKLTLTVMQPGIGKAARSQLGEIAAGLTLNWIDIDASAYRRVGVPPTPLVRKPHYFRCLIGAVLPHALQRCIYLDADTIVRSDLRNLWTIDLGDAIVGAALDYFVPRVGDAIAPWKELGLDPEAEYFNSGVMLVDLRAWRATDVGARVLRTCLRHERHLMAQGKWPQHDQFGLNAVLQGAWHRIAQDWNYLSEMPVHAPRIVHYCGGGKPRSSTCQTDFAAWFYEALDRTAWRAKAP